MNPQQTLDLFFRYLWYGAVGIAAIIALSLYLKARIAQNQLTKPRQFF